MSWFWLNVPLAGLFVAAWSGIPLWMVLRHPDRDHAPAIHALATAVRAAPAGLQLGRTSERSGQLAGV
ncbi:MAG TPA: hypothetical protein VED20_09090 [Streptosporangiaceae bacterium]|nr:hypothetical protein [Streptosporangiaceae bacterium]